MILNSQVVKHFLKESRVTFLETKSYIFRDGLLDESLLDISPLAVSLLDVSPLDVSLDESLRRPER